MVVRNNNAIKKRIGDLLVEAGVITREQLNWAVGIQKSRGGKLGDILKQLNFVSEDVLLGFLGKQCGTMFISLAEYGEIKKDVAALIPEDMARQQNLIPVTLEQNVLTVAMSDPLNVFATDELKQKTGYEIKVVIAAEKDISEAINRAFGNEAPAAPAAPDERPGAAAVAPDAYAAAPTPEAAPEEALVLESESDPGAKVPAAAEEPEPASMQELMSNLESADVEVMKESSERADAISLKSEAGEAPVIKMVNVILANAVKSRASDIHIEPYDKRTRIRFRIDGVLHPQPAPPKRYHNAIVSRIKVMGLMNVAERRLPQDGRIKIKIGQHETDLRVSTIPTGHGEKVVVRVLDSAGQQLGLENLGFSPKVLEIYKRLIYSPNGIVLVTGPTGSGKTTTLYSTLSHLNTPERNIVTIEDPVEYTLEGVNQVQAKPEIGLNFAAGLRTFLRQDPNIILVGEIRDLETVQIAINAALTGHLVFSTLHTNESAGTITRLLNMGIEPYLITSTLIMVASQRLVRTICPQCKTPFTPQADQLLAAGLKPEDLKANGQTITLYKGKGCENCAKTGYRGRLAIFEIMVMTEGLRDLVLRKAPAHRIEDEACRGGMMRLHEDALRKMKEGHTTLEEVLRVTRTRLDEADEKSS